MNQVVLQSLSQEELYFTVGGYEDDYNFGYKIGAAAKEVYNAVCDVCDDVVDWFKSTF